MKYIKKLLIFIFIICSLFVISSCSNDDTQEEAPSEARSYAVLDDGTYNFHTDLQTEYLLESYSRFSKYAKGTKELSYPQGIKIDWDEDTCPLSESYSFKLSLTEDVNDYTEYIVSDTYVVLQNLYIDTTYYYTVNESNVMSFKTSSLLPRNLYIDGITNCRDLGGYLVSEKRTNQGLIYRTSKLNKDESSESLLNEKSINTLLNDFEIKSEIDLRKTRDSENGLITKSPLGDSVKYFSIPMESSGNIILINDNAIKEVFTVLGDKSNYPLIFHCSIGTDRTGCIAFLINALLGVNEDDLYRDYLFSNFGNIGSIRTSSAIDKYLLKINQYEGSSLKEQTYNFLLSLGVSDESLDNLIDIMIN